MATTDIGRAVPLMRGEYSPFATYELNDIVTLNGSMYWHYSHTVTTNVAPQATDTWMLVLDLTAAEEYISRAESAAETAEEAKDDAVTAKTAAETASASASGSSTAASAAETAAETAKEAAIAAKDAAVSAKTDAESAKTAAQTAATAASGSATAANSSAGNAEYYAGEASTAAETATEKADEASASAATASSAATTATGAKDTAVSSAATATTKAGEASTSATSAASSAAAAQAVKDSIPEDYSELSEDVADLKTQFTQIKTNDLEYFPDTPTLSGPISSADGTVGTGAYVHTDYIDVEPNTEIICHTVLPSNLVCIAVYDADKTFLSAHNQGQGTTNFIDVPVPVPKNGRYIRCTCYRYQTDVSKFYVKYKTSLKTLYEDCISEGLYTIKDKADKHIGQNLYMPNRTQGTTSGGSTSTARKLKETEYLVGLSADGYYNASKVTSFTVQDGNVTVQSNSGFGLLFPVPCKPNTTYAVSHVSSESTLTKLNTMVSFYDADGHNVGYTSGQSGKTFTTPATAVWVCLIFGTTALATEPVTFSNIQIEEGSSVHTYHPYALNDGVNLYQGIGNAGGVLSIDDQGFVIPSADSIVARNNDVLVQAQASCMYGMWNTSAQPLKKLSILVTTDIHGKGLRLADAVEYGNAMPFVDMQVNLGDTTPSYYSDSDGSWYSAIVAQSNKPFYTMLGNHDGGNGKTAAQNATVSQSFNKWIAPNLGKMGMPSLTTPYYYVADTTYKVGMVFLNNYDVPDTTDGSGNYVVSRGAEVISQTQVDWLLGVLDNIPSDYTLIVFMHSFPYSSAADAGNWTQHQQGFSGNGVACYADLIPDIINAWKTGGSLTKTYAPQIADVTDSVSINHSFASRGTGTFACYIVGHTHKDLVGHSQTYTDQFIVGFITTADDKYQNGGSDLPRVQGTKSVDAITLVGVNTLKKRINLVRIGSNISYIMQERTMISLSYT